MELGVRDSSQAGLGSQRRGRLRGARRSAEAVMAPGGASLRVVRCVVHRSTLGRPTGEISIAANRRWTPSGFATNTPRRAADHRRGVGHAERGDADRTPNSNEFGVAFLRRLCRLGASAGADALRSAAARHASLARHDRRGAGEAGAADRAELKQVPRTRHTSGVGAADLPSSTPPSSPPRPRQARRGSWARCDRRRV